jgi:hypothetical protein
MPSPGASDYAKPPSQTTLTPDKTSILSTVDGALQKSMKPGWVIIVLGGGAYFMSETRIVGPFLAIILSCATIYQINQYFQAKKSVLGVAI